MAKTLLTLGNSKLKRTSRMHGNVKIAGFDLPQVKTCPKAGICKKYCYINKATRMYKDYRDKLECNLVQSKVDMVPVLAEIQQGGFDFIRLHSAGDFYNQRYLNKWTKIMKATPWVHFYCYSKSLHLKFPKLTNFTVIKSFGGLMDDTIKPGDYQAKVVDKVGKGWSLGNVDDLTFLKTRKIALIKH